MSRYFFNCAGVERHPDLDGCEFANLADAKLAAVTFAGAYLRDNPSLILDHPAWWVEMRDYKLALIYTVKVSGLE